MTENNIQKLDRPVEFKLPPLPKKNHNPKTLPDLKVFFGENPNKCSVFIEKGIILFDNSFKEYPPFVLQFILYHEIGHFYYRGEGLKSENNCDVFASHYMLKRGFNPSQIKIAQGITLNSGLRKKHLVNNLEKIRQK